MTSGPDPPFSLSGGVVAYNERGRIEGAVRSLLDQALPEGAEWVKLVVVVSGSTDGTADIVRGMAARDPRIELVVQPRREGKSAALAEVFARAQGDYLVLLNGDARACPGSVRALLEAAAAPCERFAVMGRPVPPTGTPGTFSSAVALLWGIHNSLHSAVLSDGSGNHLSDELLLMPVRELPPLGGGIINDGSFVGGWLVQNHGELRYAPRALVSITSPGTFREHVRQRRRIVFGHWQIRDRLAVEPLTIGRYAWRNPRRAIRLLAGETRRPGGVFALSTLLAGEALAGTLARIDAGSAGQDHVRWPPIRGLSPDAIGESPVGGLSAEGS
ncbi:MAG TPA: glycosyltransferase [Thermoplasmata archaeon]|jgi:glycosyltransferase involved in cell wall biosynthesis|nr:glycosyltransferase [Thermoplasmata archaeon]